jgi:hypothetical protein
MAVRICRTRQELADAHKSNGRRLMAAALDCFADGLQEAGEVMRWLSRMEYARAADVLVGRAAVVELVA